MLALNQHKIFNSVPNVAYIQHCMLIPVWKYAEMGDLLYMAAC